jgi:uncharacterized damage-inducible protein DinB
MTMTQTASTETARISRQLRRGFEGNAWHGPAVMELLADVTASQANQRPIPDAHTIWELVNHMRSVALIVYRRITATPPTGGPEEADFPEVTDTSEAAWKRSVDDLGTTHRALRSAIEALPDSRLSEKLEGGATVYSNLHGQVQHDLYHAGQIAILKKAFR